MDFRICCLWAALALVVSDTGGLAKAASLPPAYLDAVVAIGGPKVDKFLTQDGNSITSSVQWHTEGTGFFYGFLQSAEPNGSKSYRIYLVTAQHVVTNHPAGQNFCIRLNLRSNTSSSPLCFPGVQQQNQAAWFLGMPLNPAQVGEDVALLPVDVNVITSQNLIVQFFRSDDAEEISVLKSDQVSAGDGVFVLGFPNDMAGKDRNYTIVRQGIISRINEFLDGASDNILIDAMAFPGNSGGPVVLRPDATSIVGTKAQLSAKLLGMVVSYIPYRDKATSDQTHEPRVVFEENSGLASVVPIDVINRVISRFEATRSQAQAPVAPLLQGGPAQSGQAPVH